MSNDSNKLNFNMMRGLSSLCFESLVNILCEACLNVQEDFSDLHNHISKNSTGDCSTNTRLVRKKSCRNLSYLELSKEKIGSINNKIFNEKMFEDMISYDDLKYANNNKEFQYSSSNIHESNKNSKRNINKENEFQYSTNNNNYNSYNENLEKIDLDDTIDYEEEHEFSYVHNFYKFNNNKHRNILKDSKKSIFSEYESHHLTQIKIVVNDYDDDNNSLKDVEHINKYKILKNSNYKTSTFETSSTNITYSKTNTRKKTSTNLTEFDFKFTPDQLDLLNNTTNNNYCTENDLLSLCDYVKRISSEFAKEKSTLIIAFIYFDRFINKTTPILDKNHIKR